MGTLIRHKGALSITGDLPENKVRQISHDPKKGESYFVVSSIEEAKDLIPNLFVLELDGTEQEVLAKLRKESESAKAIDRETDSKIRAKYSLEAELKALRTNDQEYKTFIEQVVAEHNAAKDALFSL